MYIHFDVRCVLKLQTFDGVRIPYVLICFIYSRRNMKKKQQQQKKNWIKLN